MTESDDEAPKTGAGDHLHAVVRAGFGSIPVVVSAAQELFNAVVTPPLEKRRHKWCERVGERLRALEAKSGVSLDSLQGNEAFIDAALKASTAAMRTHHEVKLKALSNAVANSVVQSAPNESMQQLFIQWVDELTVDHIRFLKLFHNPSGWFQSHGRTPPEYHFAGSLSQLLNEAYPDLGNNRELYDLIAQDLAARKLFDGSGSGVMQTVMSGSGVLAKRTTPLGDKFIDFISDSDS